MKPAAHGAGRARPRPGFWRTTSAGNRAGRRCVPRPRLSSAFRLISSGCGGQRDESDGTPGAHQEVLRAHQFRRLDPSEFFDQGSCALDAYEEALHLWRTELAQLEETSRRALAPRKKE